MADADTERMRIVAEAIESVFSEDVIGAEGQEDFWTSRAASLIEELESGGLIVE